MTSQIVANQAGADSSTRIQGKRRRQLIDATLSVIAENGISNVTLAKVAGRAGLTAAMVNFHFAGKNSLLLETLRFVSREFQERFDDAIAGAKGDPVRALNAIIDTHFDPALSDPRRLAVWYAFWGESWARAEYQALCGKEDTFNEIKVKALFEQVLIAEGRNRMDADALSLAFLGMLDILWQGMLIDDTARGRKTRRKQCQRFLASIFPGSFGGTVENTVNGPSRKWICVGHLEDLEGGDNQIIEQDVNGVAVLVRKDSDGEVRAVQYRDGCPVAELPSVPLRQADGLLFVRP
ncbi:MAG: TetR family transcriptional regulator [Gammaproteobacteria bacterium]|nr:TetR family transcriptional regulator [Gammaproteobacteria bacterium]